MKGSLDSKDLRGKVADYLCYIMLYLVAVFGSTPFFSSSLVPPGFDSVMHLSKIRIFSRFFPYVPRWFPWWYCGTPSLRFYPPLSYLTANLIGWLFQTSALEAYQYTDLFSYYLAGLFMYLFMRAIGNSHVSSFASAVFYMLSPQTLYGRFFVGHFTHNFSVFLIPLSLFCIVKYGSDKKRTVLATAPLLMLLFISHLQTALSFGFMLVAYIFFNLIIGWWRWEEPRRISAHLSGLILGGALGSTLASFWLMPSLLEGLGRLGLTGEAALKLMIPIESLFIDADQLGYLPPIQKVWSRQYFLGFPMILLSIFAITLIIKRKFGMKRMFWGLNFASWVVIFLFGIVSPYLGLILGWPNRLPYFVSMPMAMLAGLAVNWIEDRFSSLSVSRGALKRLVTFSLLAVILLSPLIHTFDVNRFVYYPYPNEIEVSERLIDLTQEQTERVASFGTFSYVFNVFSDGWQLDGGYVQGQINPDFYYKYWSVLTESNDTDTILEVLNETNTRYVIIPKGSRVPPSYQDESIFDRIETTGFTIFRLKDNYTLSFITVTNGEASINYDYHNPDELHITLQNCSEDLTLTVKMNYYPGWIAETSQGEVRLERDPNGLMKIELSEVYGPYATHITLRYTQTLIDNIALGTTIAGIVAYLLIFFTTFWKNYKGAVIEHIKRLKESIQKRPLKKELTEKPLQQEMEITRPRITLRITQERLQALLYHLVSILIVSIYSLYISWPYLTEAGLPVSVDAPGHAFKVWYLIDCWSRYGVLPYFWDSWWYAGYPFLQVYPPLSYMIAAFLGETFLNGNPISGFRYAMVLSNVLAAIFTYVGIYILFRSRVGGIIGGTVYASSACRGAAVGTGMFPFYIATMFLPLIVPSYNRSLSSKSLKNYAFSASVLALILLSHMLMFVYAVLTLALYMIITSILGFNKSKILFLKKFMKNVKILFLVITLGLCLVGFWIIPFYSYRSFFYTRYPEFFLKTQSISSVHLFFQKSGDTYLGLTTLSLIILVFFISKRARKDSHMIFFSISGLLSGFLSLYQYEVFKGTIIEQMSYYRLIYPYRWVFITFLSLAFLAGGATKYICNLLEKFNLFSQHPKIRSLWKCLLTSIILCLIIFDAGGSFARGFYEVPVIRSFPSTVKDFPDEDEYYRIYANIVGLAYVPAVSNRDSLTGWYIEGSVLRDWLYNLDWMTNYGERENLIAPLLELFATRYYVTRSDDLNRIERFRRTGEFNISYKDELGILELKRDIRYLDARHSILYLGKEEDLLSVAEALLFSSNSSILIPGWKEHVDDYTIEEIREFDALLLYRYNHRDQDAMEKLLLRYVEDGGTLILALFYPNPILGMQSYYAESKEEYQIEVDEDFWRVIFRDVNVTRFSPAIYAGQSPWRYVAFNVTSSRIEVETLLKIDGNPVLVVSTVGEGKIIWIGFNFLAHINSYLNRDEGRMIGNLIDWACKRPPNIEITSFEKRPYGYVDALLKVNGSDSFWLLISETYYPGWRTYVNQKPVRVYMAEPKLMVIRVETGGNRNISISLRYEPTEVHILGFAVTILSAISLGALAILSEMRGGKQTGSKKKGMHRNRSLCEGSKVIQGRSSSFIIPCPS